MKGAADKMLDQIDINNIETAVQFISYFLFSFLGAFLKELHYANNKTDYEFAAYKVVYGTIVATFISVAFREYFIDDVYSHWEIMAFVSLVFGMLGYELYGYLSTVDGFRNLISGVKDIKDSSNDEKKK